MKITSKLCTILALLAATMLSTLGTAEANVYWWVGVTGAYGPTPIGVCNYYDVNNRRLVVRPKRHPYIYARNSTAGNDVQWVRYIPYVEDMNGNVLMWGNWLPFRQASVRRRRRARRETRPRTLVARAWTPPRVALPRRLRRRAPQRRPGRVRRARAPRETAR